MRAMTVSLLMALMGCNTLLEGVDTNTADTEWDTLVDVDTSVDTELDTEPDTDADSDADTEPDTDTDTDTEPDTDADTEPDTDADTEPDTDADTEPDTEADTEPDTDTEPPPPGWDVSTNPSCIEAHAQILRLYQSMLGRYPDVEGANYWLNQYTSNGMSVSQIRGAFAASPEFNTLYSGLSNGEFITEVYNNVLNRDPDAPGYAYWTGRLERGENTRVEVIGFISDSPEFIGHTPYEPNDFCAFIDSHAPGYVKTQIAPNTVWMRSGDGNVNVLYIDKNETGTLRVSPGATLRRPGHYGGTAAINGNWFTSSAPYFFGYSVSSGTVMGAVRDHRRGYVGDDVGHVLRIGHYGDIGGAVPTNAWAMVSGQTLVVGGNPWPDTTTATTDPTFTNAHPRTAVGVTAEGYLIWVVVDGRSFGPGMTGTQTAQLLVDLGSDRGLMLDGGGSSAMYISGRGIVNQPSDGSTRSVRNQLIFDASQVWVE